jgi:hypothetical protein
MYKGLSEKLFQCISGLFLLLKQTRLVHYSPRKSPTITPLSLIHPSERPIQVNVFTSKQDQSSSLPKRRMGRSFTKDSRIHIPRFQLANTLRDISPPIIPTHVKTPKTTDHNRCSTKTSGCNEGGYILWFVLCLEDVRALKGQDREKDV